MTSLLGQLSLETALAKNEAHMDDEWRQAAIDAVYSVARYQPHLTSDDVWDQLAAIGLGAPHEPRAIANVMLHARRHGWIVSTDRTVRCRRPSRNATTVRVWQSLLTAEEAT